MSLMGTLNVGKSALAVHQAAIQVTGNNVANAGNPIYTRQSPHLTPSADRPMPVGFLAGTGVNLESIERQIDEALEGRIRNSISDSQGALARQQWLSRVESVFQEMGDSDLSTQMSTFFNSWSNLANRPQDIGLRQIVVQNGETVAGTFRGLFGQLTSLETDVDQRLATRVGEADALAAQVAELNGRILAAESSGAGTANALRDQRDGVLKQLAGLMDIKVQDTGNGMVNVLVGSTAVVLGDASQGFALKPTSDGRTLEMRVVTQADGSVLAMTSGEVAALVGVREEINAVRDQVDALAANLIGELNKLHSSGQPMEGFTQVTGSLTGGVVQSSWAQARLAPSSVGGGVLVSANDRGAPIDLTQALRVFPPASGSFVVHVKDRATGLVTSTLVQVQARSLDGDNTTLESLRQDLDNIDGLRATLSGGQLRLATETGGYEFTFSQDSSGALAALGINTFFGGTGAQDIAVRNDLKARPSLLAAAQNGQAGDNQTARAIAGLESTNLPGLQGVSLKNRYQAMVDGLAVSVSSAKTGSEAALAVQDTLQGQRESLSGVSLDEEAINLMREQRAFQAAARLVTAVDELMRTILQMV